MSFENLPGIFPNWIDGNLQIAAASGAPVVLVLGTAPRGDTEVLYRVNSVSDAAHVFGRTDGTLVRGLYEVYAGGATNIRLMRIGATPAVLTGVGGTAPNCLTITTVMKDADAGAAYKIYYKASEKRVRLYRSSDGELVYDNNPTYPSAAIDLNELSVTGIAAAGSDIGSASVPVTLVAANAVGGAVYTAGNDGILLSRMELFEHLFQAYKVLENEDINIVVPRNVYLDDDNVEDMTTTQVSTLNMSAPWAASSIYPTPGTAFDALGKVFAQEYEGQWYFWWDMDRDGQAEIYPSNTIVPLSTATHGAFAGDDLELADFHEANFGYQLTDFCYRQSEDNQEMIGMIGMLPPVSWALKDVANWIGKLPTYTDDGAGNLYIAAAASNGSGLLGNKWRAGRHSNSSSGLPGMIVDSVDGLAYGGFIATDNGWPDGAEQQDRNEHLIDIGKYLSVVAAQAILANVTNPTAYVASGAAVYAGFVSSLAANSAPTNKLIPGVRLPFRVSVAKLDDLAGLGYVMYQQKSKGIVVSDAPTATRPDSDYQRLSTVRIVKATIDALRSVAEPFLGEPITGARLAALETAIKQALTKLQKLEYLQRYQVAVISTPTQQVQGKADVELILVPAFELRQITVYVSLAAQ